MLVAPAEPGLYEVRYVLQEGSRSAASAPVEVVEAELGIAAPQQVTTGAKFSVTWSASIHRQDYVTIVPAGADEGSEGNYFRVRDDAENTLVAPAEPGLYEVRYVLQEGRRTLAAAPVEVAGAEIALGAPDIGRAETDCPTTRSASNHQQDYVTKV